MPLIILSIVACCKPKGCEDGGFCWLPPSSSFEPFWASPSVILMLLVCFSELRKITRMKMENYWNIRRHFMHCSEFLIPKWRKISAERHENLNEKAFNIFVSINASWTLKSTTTLTPCWSTLALEAWNLVLILTFPKNKRRLIFMCATKYCLSRKFIDSHESFSAFPPAFFCRWKIQVAVFDQKTLILIPISLPIFLTVFFC